MDFLREHQLLIMLVLACFCAMQALNGLIMDIKPYTKKFSLVSIELSVMILLISDRLAYLYRGDPSELGFYIVRISNFLVFAINYALLISSDLYIISVIRQNGKHEKIPGLLKLVFPVAFIGLLLLIISQKNNFYYYIDENNLYHRSKGFIICYILPLLIMIFQLITTARYRGRFRRGIWISLMVFLLGPLVASIMQIFSYGLSLTNISIGVSAMLLFILAIIDQNQILMEASQKEINSLKNINQLTKAQFRETVLALASAIDAKDEYTHGHSRRVAEYSKKIAQATGRSEQECEDLYFAALLHDVGKIGVPDSILTKNGRLTNEEFQIIQQHTTLGYQILHEISGTSNLTDGAHYHHERFNGKGYPEGLKGQEIPEIARIIAVADAYDAMTSNRSYRTTLAQQKVREELVKGLGSQFDPEFATAMIHILDKDTEYHLKEDVHIFDGLLLEYTFDEFGKKFADGIEVSDYIKRISFKYQKLSSDENSGPSIRLYDSLDGRVHTDSESQQKMDFTQFLTLDFHGEANVGSIRLFKTKEYANPSTRINPGELIIEIVRQKDHVLIKLFIADRIQECTIALNDRSLFTYLAISGYNCRISDVNVSKSQKSVPQNYIQRIVPEVSYIEGKKEGNLKNLEIAGWREQHSDGISIDSKIELSFDSMSLPAAKRLWHCPIMTIYTSEDGKVNGPGFREFALIRFDGESWEEDSAASNVMVTSFDSSFEDWENWKEANRKGVSCKATIERIENNIYVKAEHGGLHMSNVTTISEDVPKLYCALTGDQVAITNIQIQKK